MAQTVVIAGGTGFIGRAVTQHLLDCGYEVTVLSRQSAEADAVPLTKVKQVRWLTSAHHQWHLCLEDAHAVINLCGQSIAAQKWTPKVKEALSESRLNPSLALAAALEKVTNKPKVFVQASGVGYYGYDLSSDTAEDAPKGKGFLAELCEDWEGAVANLANVGIRLAIARFGVVLGWPGGMLGEVVPLYKSFKTAYPGNGRQWLSWIHINDAVHALQWIIEKPDLSGPINLCSPHPVTAKQFYQSLGRQLHRPLVVPAPAFLIRSMMGEMAQEIHLASQKAIPQRLEQSGFQWQFKDVKAALQEVLANQ